MSNNIIQLIQITDCHLTPQPGGELLSMDTDEGLQDVLALINDNHAKSDLLIVTGDIASDAVVQTYQRLYQILSTSIRFPFAWLPGNHDNAAAMAQLGEAVNCKVHIHHNWLIIMLDSLLDGYVHGYLQEKELKFLGETLSQHPDKHTIVCLHHQPVPIGSQWMDEYIVRNARDFWQVIEQHSQVKIVLWGHVHQEFESQYKGIALFATPSTCIQFTPEQKDFAVENTMPGYRWFELHEDGSFCTKVERVAKKDYGIDFQSVGY